MMRKSVGVYHRLHAKSHMPDISNIEFLNSLSENNTLGLIELASGLWNYDSF